jgi:Protein of unknown function (DUF1266)
MDKIIGIGVTVLLLVACVVCGIWFSRAKNASRRTRELSDPNLGRHWVLIAAYRGTADPTLLTREAAAKILRDWGCTTPEELRRKLDLYRRGELNHAFDAVRVLWLSELGLAAQYLAPPDVSALSAETISRLRGVYGSWAQYADELLVGRQRWFVEIGRQGSMPDAERQQALDARRESERLQARFPW